MHRYAQRVSEKKIPPDFGPMAHGASESTPRAAHVRLGPSRYLAGEQARPDSTYAIGVRNLADAAARRVTAGSLIGAGADHQLSSKARSPKSIAPSWEPRFRREKRKPLMLRRLCLACRFFIRLNYSWHLAWHKAARPN